MGVRMQHLINQEIADRIVDADIEVKVRMLNINYGKSKKLIETCEPFREYALLVDKTIRLGVTSTK